MRYRADDRYGHPIISESMNVQNVVVRMDRNKESDKIEKVEVVGVVDSVMRFRGICPRWQGIGVDR